MKSLYYIKYLYEGHNTNQIILKPIFCPQTQTVFHPLSSKAGHNKGTWQTSNDSENATKPLNVTFKNILGGLGGSVS